MSDAMWALTYNREKQPWESTVGLSKDEVERPAINEAKDYHDRASVLVKPIMTGFCGSDRGIWFRTAFKDMIMKSLDRDKKPVRTIGHELLGRIVDLGTDAPHVRPRGRRHRDDREPHRLRHLLPVPDRRHARLRRRQDHRHQRGRLLRRDGEAPGEGALADGHVAHPPGGRGGARALR